MTSTAMASPRVLLGIDRRVWFMAPLICFFAVLIMKEVSLPPAFILAFSALGLLSLLVIGLRSPEISLYVLVAYLPFSRMLVGDFGTHATALNLTNILALWVLAAHVLRQAARGQSIFQTSPLNRAILLLSLLGALSLLRAGWVYGSWYTWHNIISLKRWLTPMLFYFVAMWVIRDARTLKTVTVLIMLAVTAAAIMAIRDYLYVADSSFESSRVEGIAGHPNALGAFFNYYMFLFVGFFLMAPRKLKSWLLLIPFLLCFRGVMVTFSRGAYLACATGGLAVSWFRSKLLFVIALMVGVFALLNPWMMPSGIRYRMGQTITDNQRGIYQEELGQNLEASAASRIEIWKGALAMIRDYPWWGVGYEAFSSYISRYTQGQIGHMDAHNSYLLIAAEMGLPTLLVFLMVLCMVCYYTHWLYRHTEDRAMKAIALGFLGGLAGLWVANIFGSRMDHEEVSGYFWILSGLIMRGVLIERQAISDKQQATRRKKLPATVAS